jgi:hypothetical protein
VSRLVHPRVLESIGGGGVVLCTVRISSRCKQIDCRYHTSEDVAVHHLPRLRRQAAVIIAVVIASWVVCGQRTAVTARCRFSSVSREIAGELC